MDNIVKEQHQLQDRFCQPDDDYEHADDSAEYIVENILMEKPCHRTSKSFDDLSHLYNSFYDSHCNCAGATNNCGDYQTCNHGGGYYYYCTNELILNKQRCVKDLLYECNAQCSCSLDLCKNRLVQRGPRKHLKIIKSSKLINQFALTTEQDIPEGGFVCEYAGELLTESEAFNRNVRNRDQQLKNYLICLNEYPTSHRSDSAPSFQGIQTFIDAGIKSNIGRYLNHSCDPNCEILSVRIDGPVPKLAIFARKHILAGEELCFDYGDVKSTLSDKQQCFCGTAKCRKYF